MNEQGYTTTLVASHPGNVHAQRSGAFSRRGLAQDPEVRELSEQIMVAEHTVPLDEVGAIEIAKLTILIDRIDADLAKRGITKGKGAEPRTILDVRLRASRRLAEWCDRYGMTPKGRAEWARQLAEGGLAAEIARRRAQESPA